MLSPKKLLENARNRIAKTENWTQHRLCDGSGDDGGTPDATSPDATCWCSVGALFAEAGIPNAFHRELSHPNLKAAMDALNTSMNGTTWGSIPGFNDTRTHEAVLEAFDRAIAEMRSE